jgi:16S rRNA (cytosine1402-N4)-methyltransferase
MSHISVLLHESIEGLDIHEGDVFVDGTLGDGGHTAEVIKKFGSTSGKITVVGIDRDQDAIDRVTKKFTDQGILSSENGAGATQNIFLKLGNFRNVEEILASVGLHSAQRFLFDIGLSSRQIDESGRGFTFQKDEPLLMTFEKTPAAGAGAEAGASTTPTAREVVNEWSEQNLAQIIEGFGEERFAYRIAKGIVAARTVKPIETTGELVEIIKKSTPFYYHHGRIHPATRTFQAIRIAVNDELEAIRDAMKSAWKLLTPGGRIAVISFHSLEDRIVKHYFNELKEAETEDGKPIARVITKKPITARDEEISQNPRSRSAKLRIIEKIAQ